MRKYRLATRFPHRYGRWEFRMQMDGSICVSEFHGNRSVMTIPPELLGRPVTALGRAFLGPNLMQLLILPDTVRSIGPYACSHSEDLMGVVIPASVTHIDDTAFEGQQENEDFILFVQEGSCAHAFAEEKGFSYELDTIPEIGENEESLFSGPWHYGLVDGEVVLREYNGTEAVLEVPAEIDGCPVTGMSACCFHGNDFIEELVIPEGVTYMGSYAVAACDSLRRVHLPDSMTKPGIGCFAECRDLEDIRLPMELECIPPSFFSGCLSLRRIKLPPRVRIISMIAFACCSALEEIDLGDSLETVCISSFFKCPNLRIPALPDTLDEESRAILAALPEA